MTSFIVLTGDELNPALHRAQRVLNAPDVRTFAKQTIIAALTLDPVDALADLELATAVVRDYVDAKLAWDLRATKERAREE